MPTNFPNRKDAPLAITSTTKVDATLLKQYDDQIQALGAEIVALRNSPFSFAFQKVDPSASAIQPGYGVAVKANAVSGEALLVLATSANLAAGAVYAGVAAETIPPGQLGRVATGGILPNSITGLGTGPGSFIRVNATTAALERVVSFTSNDVFVGMAHGDGAVVIKHLGPTTNFAAHSTKTDLLGSSPTANNAAVLAGVAAAGDGGGGSFVWDATSTDADDGGTVLAPNPMVAGRFVRLFSGPLDVRYFGAKGDGTTDDTAAIQAAIDAAAASSAGHYVHFQPGMYKVIVQSSGYALRVRGVGDIDSVPHPRIIELRGAGRYSSTIYVTNPNSVANSVGILCDHGDGENYTVGPYISDLGVRGANVGIRAYMRSEPHFARVRCYQCTTSDIQIDTCNMVRIDDCFLEGTSSGSHGVLEVDATFGNNTITNATNTNPVVITTATPHGQFSGVDQVYISDLVGNTAPNGNRYPVTVLSPTTFSIPVAGNGAYVSGGTVTGTRACDQIEIHKTYIHGQDLGAECGIKMDRCGGFNIIGGHVESAGVGIKLASKDEPETIGRPVGPGIIAGIGLENCSSSYIEMGYASVGFSGIVRRVSITAADCALSGSTGTYRGIKAKNTIACRVERSNIPVTATDATRPALIWLETDNSGNDLNRAFSVEPQTATNQQQLWTYSGGTGVVDYIARGHGSTRVDVVPVAPNVSWEQARVVVPCVALRLAAAAGAVTGDSSGTYVPVSYDQKPVDDASELASGPWSTYTATQAGVYRIEAQVGFHNLDGAITHYNQVDVVVVINGSTYFQASREKLDSSGGQYWVVPLSGVVPLAVTDTVQVKARVYQGDNVTPSVEFYPIMTTLSIHKLLAPQGS